ncbi:MAG: 3-oxo-5-alpha-steroid 4-dehydrogenase [Bacteroidetes bacterium]|nr:3-oxo-5-alpha-steroid 4-dehydrogenase [Bacteroidota bacterium]
MISRELFFILLFIWALMAVAIFPILLKITVPYGRHASRKWGAVIPARWGWFIMELPVIVVFVWLFFTGPVEKTLPLLIIFGLFMIHYIHRIFIFPFMMRSSGKPMPLVIVMLAVFFNLINGFFNGYWFGYLTNTYAMSWLYDPRFVVGIILFAGGMYLNMSSDYHLISLRKGRNQGYFIPTWGLFRRVSSPNLLGEIIEWMGWAVMSWCWPAAAFSLWTMANLIPRALNHHHWYKRQFPDYPKERRALFPWVKK